MLHDLLSEHTAEIHSAEQTRAMHAGVGLDMHGADRGPGAAQSSGGTGTDVRPGECSANHIMAQPTSYREADGVYGE